MLAHMDRVMVEGGYLQQGQLVVFLAGQPVGRPGTTNLMKLHRVGSGVGSSRRMRQGINKRSTAMDVIEVEPRFVT